MIPPEDLTRAWDATSPAFAGPPTGCYHATETTLQALGVAVGKEAKSMGYHGWYAPAMNCHRTPFNARNLEYYSEDGVLAGKTAAGVVRGDLSLDSLGGFLGGNIKRVELEKAARDKATRGILTKNLQRAAKNILWAFAFGKEV